MFLYVMFISLIEVSISKRKECIISGIKMYTLFKNRQKLVYSTCICRWTCSILPNTAMYSYTPFLIFPNLSTTQNTKQLKSASPSHTHSYTGGWFFCTKFQHAHQKHVHTHLHNDGPAIRSSLYA